MGGGGCVMLEVDMERQVQECEGRYMFLEFKD